MNTLKSTTVLCVRRDDRVAMGADGQVTLGQVVLKADSRKIRRLAAGRVLVGFAGAAADAFRLLERLDGLLEEYPGGIVRAATELAKEWRTDKILRRLECLLAVADAERSLLISGSGEIIEPSDGIIGIGSGGAYALAAARALLRDTELGPPEIVRRAIGIAGEICIYTNQSIVVEEL